MNTTRFELSTRADHARFALTPVPEGRTLPTLTGYAIVWGAVSADIRNARIANGAVTFPTDGSPVHALYNHDYRDVIGSTANGTLRLVSDDVGLRVEIDPPDTQAGRDVVTLVRGGYVAGMSFGMYGIDSVESIEGGRAVTTYTRIIVDEVTITCIPAFPVTTIEVKPEATPFRTAQELQSAELDFANLTL